MKLYKYWHRWYWFPLETSLSISGLDFHYFSIRSFGSVHCLCFVHLIRRLDGYWNLFSSVCKIKTGKKISTLIFFLINICKALSTFLPFQCSPLITSLIAFYRLICTIWWVMMGFWMSLWALFDLPAIVLVVAMPTKIFFPIPLDSFFFSIKMSSWGDKHNNTNFIYSISSFLII